MPVPFPLAFIGRGASSVYHNQVNDICLVVDWLAGGKPSKVSNAAHLHTPPITEQSAQLQNIEESVSKWDLVCVPSVEGLGRLADKFTNSKPVLHRLEGLSKQLRADLDP